MNPDTMASLIVAMGILITVPSSFALIGPRAIASFASNFVISTGLRIFAGGVRIAFGIALIVAAAYIPMTAVVRALGGVVILIGVVVLFVNNERMQSFVDWATSLSSTAIRLSGVIGLGLGVFLIYAGI